MSPFSFLRRHPRGELTEYADGRLTSERQAVVEQHVAVCPACTAEIDDLRQINAALRSMPQADVPRSFALTPQQVAAPEPTPRREPAAPLVFGMRLASAGVAMALALVVAVDLDGGNSNDSGGDDDAGALSIAADRSSEEALGDVAENDVDYDDSIEDAPAFEGGDDSANLPQTGVDGSDSATAQPPDAAVGTFTPGATTRPIAGAPGGGDAGVGGTPGVPTGTAAAGGVGAGPAGVGVGSDPAATDLPAGLAAEPTPTNDLRSAPEDTDAVDEDNAKDEDADETLANAPIADGDTAYETLDASASDDDSDNLLIAEIALAVALVIAVAGTIYVSRRARRPF